jgi:hypothetical protein
MSALDRGGVSTACGGGSKKWEGEGVLRKSGRREGEGE